MRVVFAVVLAAVFVAACAEAEPPAPRAPAARAPRQAPRAPEGFPAHLTTEPGLGPSLFMGPAASAAAFGYISGGLQLTVAGAPEGDRVPVRIRGPIKARAWVPLARVSARATRRGRVRGAPVSVRPGDRVGIRGRRDAQTLIVSVRPNLGPDVSMDPFEGDFPAAWISGEARGASAASTADAEPASELGVFAPGPMVVVYDRPRGRVIANVPQHTQPIPVQVARRSGEFSAVRIGYGPYLTGWVRTPIQIVETQPELAAAPAPAAHPPGVPARIQHDARAPLVRVRVGTRIRFGGVVVGVIDQLAYARVLRTHPNGDVDVFVAVNDDVAVRGLVHARDIAASAPPVADDAADEEADAGANTHVETELEP